MTDPGPAWLEADWPAPPAVRVLTSLRCGGVSAGAYATLNLALHVGDREDAVLENRRRLRAAAAVPAEPLWLTQVHGRDVVRHGQAATSPQADATVAFERGRVCAVLTADCLPVVLVDQEASRIAVAHAGWRGLAAGVLEAAVDALAIPPARLTAWLGPAISQPSFEVGAEVHAAFLRRSPEYAQAFAANDRGRWHADLYALARIALSRAGVASVHGGGWCTYLDAERFYSFRRDRTTGRMATLAWLA